MTIRLVSRVVIYQKGKLLLVRNKNENFWYPPGGAWNYEKENIIEAAIREVKEETGLNVRILRMLYVQEFHPLPDTVFFESFWLAEPLPGQVLDKNHTDLDPSGQVGAIEWFSKDQTSILKVFPKRLKNTFWNRIQKIKNEEDPFIGVSWS